MYVCCVVYHKLIIYMPVKQKIKNILYSYFEEKFKFVKLKLQVT